MHQNEITAKEYVDWYKRQSQTSDFQRKIESKTVKQLITLLQKVQVFIQQENQQHAQHAKIFLKNKIQQKQSKQSIVALKVEQVLKLIGQFLAILDLITLFFNVQFTIQDEEGNEKTNYLSFIQVIALAILIIILLYTIFQTKKNIKREEQRSEILFTDRQKAEKAPKISTERKIMS